MLLSDELLEIGRNSNKMNNLSMNNAAQKIIEKVNAAGLPIAQENYMLKYVFSALDKEGYKHFGFLLEKTEKNIKSKLLSR